MIGRPRLGLGIGRDRVSAVLIVGNAVRWADCRTRGPDTSLVDALTALLADCPRRRWYPLTVSAALGPAVSQVKCLTELPPLNDARAIGAVVRENTSRFFLKNGVPLLVSRPHIESADRVWVAALDTPVVVDVATACQRAGMRLRTVVPTALALRHAIRGKSIRWVDGDVGLDITYGEKAPISIRRVPVANDETPVPVLVEILANLAGKAPRVLDAAGAALSRRGESAVAPGDVVMRGAIPVRSRTITAAVAFGITVVLALAAPELVAIAVQRRARADIALVERHAHAARADEVKLARTTAALRDLADFANSRRSMTLLLAEITRSLADSTALVAFQVDSSGLGSVVAVASHAALVVDAVERTPGLASPQIVGPVTRESMGGHAVERVTVRFQVVGDGAR